MWTICFTATGGCRGWFPELAVLLLAVPFVAVVEMRSRWQSRAAAARVCPESVSSLREPLPEIPHPSKSQFFYPPLASFFSVLFEFFQTTRARERVGESVRTGSRVLFVHLPLLARCYLSKQKGRACVFQANFHELIARWCCSVTGIHATRSVNQQKTKQQIGIFRFLSFTLARSFSKFPKMEWIAAEFIFI